MIIDYDKYKNIEIDKEKFKDLPTDVNKLRECLAICNILIEDKDYKIIGLETERDVLNSKVSDLKADKKYLQDKIKDSNEFYIYKALYFKEKQKLQSIIFYLEKYSYLLPDEYKHIIKEILKKEKGIVYHD